MTTTPSVTARLSVVVPAYNEENTLRTVVEKLLNVPLLHEVIIVDDCSTDNTQEVARSLSSEYPLIIRVMRHPKNAGKTEALKTGFASTTGNIVIVQDADLEYNPDEIAYVIEPIVKGVAEVVFGSRFQVRSAARVLYFYHYLANQWLTFLSDLLTNLNLTDVETGYKAFRGEIIRNMVITSSGFGFEIEVTAKVAKLKCAIYEVPISYYGRTYEEGKKIGTKDALAALWYLVKYNLLTDLQASFSEIPRWGPLSAGESA
ncbi:MAG TPA: glycosyltransferase family 2 protein [Acidobacteriaceae bacterium]|nr:glycosyltransferase family 2 protein [Acidobacteriaceae bacterium]